MAVLPLADLSRDANAVDLEATAQLVEHLRATGLTVSPEEEVRRFMAENRMRWTGYIDRFFVTNLGEVLDVDWVLVGSITQKRETPSPSLSVSLVLISTTVARISWAANLSLAAGEAIAPLGIGALQSLAELSERLWSRVRISLPEAEGGRSFEIPAYALTSYDLSSRFVMGGGQMVCRVGFRFYDEPPQDVFLKLGGKEINRVSMAREGSFFVARWNAPKEEGRYPLSTIVRWKGRREDVKFLATYRVVNEEPEMVMTLGNGVPIGTEGVVAFRSSLSINTKVSRVAPIVSYRFLVTTPDGGPVLDYKSNDALPESLVWRGAGEHGPLGGGYYDIALSAWDAVGHEVSSSARVYLRKSPPRVQASLGHDPEKGAFLKLEAEPDQITGEIDPMPVKLWQVRLVDSDQNEVLEDYGDSLPAVITFDPGDKRAFFCSYEVRDLLGNELKLKGRPLRLVIAEEGEEEVKDTGDWTEEF